MELPRVLQVQQFTAAREPELRGLWESLRSLGRLDGSKLLPRHLRRRATSHRRYICRRRPNLVLAQQQQQQQQQQEDALEPRAGQQPAKAAPGSVGHADVSMTEADQAAAAAAAAAIAAVPPAAEAAAAAHVRPLNRRQRRRPALLQQQCLDSCSRDIAAPDAAGAAAAGRRLESHVWHARRMRMCIRFGHVLAAGAVGRAKGSRSLLHQAMTTSQTTNPKSRFYAAKPQSGSSSSGVAAAAAGPVRAVCHDASYWCCLQLQGQQQQLVQLLSSMSDPVLVQQLLDRREVLAGAAEVQLVLHAPGKFPAGTLGSALLMWHQPPRQQLKQEKQQRKQHRGQQQQQQQHAAHGQQQELQQQQQQQQSSRDRKQQQLQQQQRVLWLWCHASYFKQVHDAIQDSINSSSGSLGQEHDSDTAAAGVLAPVSLAGVSVQSLCSSLRRVELLGPSADLVLRAALLLQQQQHQRGVVAAGTASMPSSRTSSSSSSRVAQHNKVWAALAAAPSSAWQGLPPGCVLGLAALDPRLAKPLKHSGMSEAPEWVPRDTAAAGGGGGKELQRLLSHWPQNGRRWLSGGQPLLRKPSTIPPAAPEVLISNWRQQQQAAVLSLAPTQLQQQQGAASGGVAGNAAAAAAAGAGFGGGAGSGSSAAMCRLEGLKLSPYGITRQLIRSSSSSSSVPVRRQQQQHMAAGGDEDMPEAAPQESSPPPAAAAAARLAGCQVVELPLACPMLLVRQCRGGCSSLGWSLLLPAGWVGPCWQALTFAGAKPAGLREWSWVAAAHQSPALPPHDFPDSLAAAAAAAELHAEVAAAAARRPVGRLRLLGCMLPYLDWRRLGQQLLVSSGGAHIRSAHVSICNEGDTSLDGSSSSGHAAAPAPAAVCWAAVAQLQTAARAAKLRQRRRRQPKRQQQQQAQQAGTQQQQQQQQQQLTKPGGLTRAAVNSPAGQAQQSSAALLQQLQQQQSLLPAGWYVARTWRVLQEALQKGSYKQQQRQQQQQQGAGRAMVVVPGVLAAGRDRSRALSRAVQQGRLAWVPRTASPTAAAAAAAGPAAGAAEAAAAAGVQHTGASEADAMEVDEAAAGCDAGDAAAAAPAGTSHAQQQQQHQEQQETCLVRVSVKVIGRGRCEQGALLLTQPAPLPAAAAGPSSSSSRDADGSGPGVANLLGYVTTAVPRGSPASLYPGGSGFCSVQALWRLRCQDVTAGSSRVLRVWLLNPGSSAVRRAELTLLLDG